MLGRSQIAAARSQDCASRLVRSLLRPGSFLRLQVALCGMLCSISQAARICAFDTEKGPLPVLFVVFFACSDACRFEVHWREPYASAEAKHELCDDIHAAAGLFVRPQQMTNWCANMRSRVWRPALEDTLEQHASRLKESLQVRCIHAPRISLQPAKSHCMCIFLWQLVAKSKSRV